ncbi:4'-phosphopantetheinyl transferase superfamily protein [Flavobacteriaceae bacterium F89]|uniref:4'-phosphopantetheinyl transferase superfamily protein n=1 Tax=Cerina litoralis TaxID=2874477 RepID=A0AAE3JQF8_9FLAO|nr:4'-phosphopantetheinyl transferase superfamily protein [Cerina litoralis]MCG2460213.1 4'-phosphopantetheinyl transferase superfamily protein [Cerina litoralis]
MPLYKTIAAAPGVKVYIWKIEESEDELSKGIVLTDHCQKRMDCMKSQLHRQGFLSIRHLLAEAGYVDQDLFYDDVGKPHLKDGRHISITHSHTFTGIIIGDEVEVGIDIEMQREKILRIANKFTPIEEYKTLANTDALVRKLTIVWGAKESLYKIYAHPGLSFLYHVDVKDFSFDDTGTTAEILFHGDTSYYLIHFLEFEGFTCVYAIKSS